MVRLAISLLLAFVSMIMQAQSFKAARLEKAVEALGLHIVPYSVMPDTTITIKSKDGRTICLRTDPMNTIEHIGIPLFNDIMRYLQPSPVYDFLEYALLNWKYKVNPNQLYLSKVIFKKGNWETLLRENLLECECSIENLEDKLYVAKWLRNDKEVAIIGIPIEYELLNNDSRRNMERQFIKNLANSTAPISKSQVLIHNEDELSIYGTEGLFVIPGKSYIISFLNQNVYYKLTTVVEAVDTVINNRPVTMNIEAIMPVVVNDNEFPAESFANLMMCDDLSVPDVNMELDFHLSNYHRERMTIPLRQLKSFCRHHRCGLYFASDAVSGDNAHGLLVASNLPNGYNHLFCLSIDRNQIMSDSPKVKADVYLYIPPIDKSKLFGVAPTKKSNAKFKLP